MFTKQIINILVKIIKSSPKFLGNELFEDFYWLYIENYAPRISAHTLFIRETEKSKN